MLSLHPVILFTIQEGFNTKKEKKKKKHNQNKARRQKSHIRLVQNHSVQFFDNIPVSRNCGNRFSYFFKFFEIPAT